MRRGVGRRRVEERVEKTDKSGNRREEGVGWGRGGGGPD